MTNFAAARRMMVDGQVRTADVTDLRLLAAMDSVPRERFVAAGKAELSYLDQDIPAGPGGRCLLKPMVLAKLIQMADIGPADHVLDVGCATGYSSALLAQQRLGDDLRRPIEQDGIVRRLRRATFGQGSGHDLDPAAVKFP